MTSADWAFDGLLACALPVLAWRVLVTRDLSKAVVMFIAFGLVSALSWARLDAPDIALVEAAVGAGLTGALLVNTLDWIEPAGQVTPEVSWRSRSLLAVLMVLLAVAIGGAVVVAPEHPGLANAVHEQLAHAGVEHPVTAVLLNFRGYDTLLEIAVLLVAAIAVRSTGGRSLTARTETPEADPLGALVGVLVRVLVPTAILVAGYLLWRGADAPGGAFQAGAVLGGGGVLLVLARTMQAPRMSSLWVRGGLVLGFAWFLVVAAAPLVMGDHILEYAPGWATGLIFSIELVLMISIGLILFMFFPGEAPARTSGRIESEEQW